MKSLQQMAEEVVAWCTRKGWEPDRYRTFGDECALLHSEVSEALEACRRWGFKDATKDPSLLCADPQCEEIECDHEVGEGLRQAKPEGVASEFADILIRLLHYAHVHGIDLEQEYERKMAYNERRSWRHGGRGL